MTGLLPAHEQDWYEASARERIAGLLDPGSFVEVLGPEQRAMSPHLAQFDLTGAFDDGLVVGRGLLDGKAVLIAAQEGRFLGGAFGEVHGAKLVGLLRAARDGAKEGGPQSVLLLLDTGGVRLQEANVGELAISEIIRAIVEARIAGIAVIALVGGRSGAFGGGGIVTACCSRIVVSEHARISVSGPEVIETNKGVEEFDSKDRALVWRVTGGRTRRLTGGADRYVKGRVQDFRDAAIALVEKAPPLTIATLQAEQRRLAERLRLYGDAKDAPEIWEKAGLSDPTHMADLTDDQFLALPMPKEADHDAR
ncbi:biotin-independent malonate decarboxylase subunit beta [Beijerinckia sp. L45]|uniref:biotin-independent malonate decarboxylase subunit beta n=1 Tax=Beijerinckia sp. L45 TaxID=1641855 RepID=UPI00131DE161|nr:biotin-independent malonate decarboxylase subunit beta [Beijerinckia sp. L45]